MRYCCVPMCTSCSVKKVPGISFHEIPSNVEMRNKWIKAISRKSWEPTSYTVVCSNHFKPDDFSKSNTKRRQLLPTAVPSVFPNYPTYMQHKSPKKRSNLAIAKRKALQKSPTQDNKQPNKNTGSPDITIIQKPACAPCDMSVNCSEFMETDHHEECSSSKVHFGCQVHVLKRERQVIMKAWKQKLKNQNTRIHRLKQQLEEMKQELAARDGDKEDIIKYKVVMDSALKGDNYSHILIDQVRNFNRKLPLWSETTIRNCVIWRNCSVKGYNFARKNYILRLPDRSTLIRTKRFCQTEKVEVHCDEHH